MTNNVVSKEFFLKRKETQEKGKIIKSLDLTGNSFKGNMIVEHNSEDTLTVKIVYNFNNNVIIVKEDFSVYDGIDTDVLIAKIAEELAVNMIVDSFKQTMIENPEAKRYFKRTNK